MLPGKFDDRDPISERINEHIENSAAVKMMQQGDRKNPNEEVPIVLKLNVVRWISIGIFVILFLVCAVFGTAAVARELDDRFERNFDYVTKYLTETMDDENSSLNSIYYLDEIKEEYQQFSAAIYDKNGKQLLLTEPYVCFGLDGKVYYFPMDDYFNQEEKDFICKMGATSVKVVYLIEADIDTETETLLRLELIRTASDTNAGESAWKWENTKVKSKEFKTFQLKGTLSRVVSNPYYNVENAYDKWIEDEYLHGFDEEVNPKGLTEDDTQRVVWLTEDAENERIMIVRTSTSPVLAAMDSLSEMYVVGLAVVTVGISIMIFAFRRVKKEEQK